MTHILTDAETGEKYELVPIHHSGWTDDGYALRPLRKPEPKKWEVGLQADGDIWITIECSKAQAELIKDCVEAVMEEISISRASEAGVAACKTSNAIVKARKAIKEDRDE